MTQSIDYGPEKHDDTLNQCLSFDVDHLTEVGDSYTISGDMFQGELFDTASEKGLGLRRNLVENRIWKGSMSN